MFINLARVKHVVLGAIIADGLYYLTGLLWPISMGSTANENGSCHDSNQLRLCLTYGIILIYIQHVLWYPYNCLS